MDGPGFFRSSMPSDAVPADTSIRATGWQLLKKNGPAGTTKAIADPEVREKDRDQGGRFLLCSACLNRITHTREGIEVDGSHRHTFANPHGYIFRIGCFFSAPGCIAERSWTSEATWFPGYSWSIEVCGRCFTHVGWEYRSEKHQFHGLVLDRLVEEDSAKPAGESQ